MNKTSWILIVVVAIVFGGAGYWAGHSSAPTAQPGFAGAGGNAAGRGGGRFFAAGGASGGAAFGTILSVTPTSLTIQLPTATSSAAETGTKIVLYGSSTQVEQMQSVPASNLAAGQSILVTGTPNGDGSITADSIQIRPAGSRAGAPMIPAGQ